VSWVTDFAPERDDLDSCVTCGLCLPFCPTFRLTGDETASPRGRLAAILAVARGEQPVDERFDEMMSFCLQCRACEPPCPSMVPYGKIQERVRAELLVQRPSLRRFLRRLVLGRGLASPTMLRTAGIGVAVAQRLGLTRLVGGPTGRSLRALRRVSLPLRPTRGRSWEPRGTPVGTVALFSGCVMDVWFTPVHEALVDVLRVAGYRVVAPASQVCCGALAAHDGAAFDAVRMAAHNVRAFAEVDLVVVDAAGCGAHLRDYGHWVDGGAELAAKTVDATVLVARLLDDGALPELEGDRGEVAVQDPCHLRHAQRIVEEPRRVLRAAGYVPVEIDDLGLCCGAAGIYGLSYPDTSAELGRRKAAQVRDSGASVVASANPGCELQLRGHLDVGIEVRHPIELYRDALLDELTA